jgi:effector-binding domain-containing protein
VGPYDTLGKTYAVFPAYMAAHAYTANGASFSSYVDDPATTPADKLRTDIYWPIQ